MKQVRNTEHNYHIKYYITAVLTFGEIFFQSRHGSYTDIQNFKFVDDRSRTLRLLKILLRLILITSHHQLLICIIRNFFLHYPYWILYWTTSSRLFVNSIDVHCLLSSLFQYVIFDSVGNFVMANSLKR